MRYALINGQRIYPDADGESHINIYSTGRTEIGRWMSNFQSTPTLTPHGVFSTLEGYYHYLKVVRSLPNLDSTTEFGHEVLKTCAKLKVADGHRAKNLGGFLRTICSANGQPLIKAPDSEMRQLFKEALRNKLLDEPSKLNAILDYTESGYALVHYYVYNDEVVYKKHFDWLPDLYRELLVELA